MISVAEGATLMSCQFLPSILIFFALFSVAITFLYVCFSRSFSPSNAFIRRMYLCVSSHKYIYDKYIVMQSKVRSISDNQVFVGLLLTSTSHNNSQCPRSLSQSRRFLLFSHSLSESRFGTRSAYAFSNASRLAFESARA